MSDLPLTWQIENWRDSRIDLDTSDQDQAAFNLMLSTTANGVAQTGGWSITPRASGFRAREVWLPALAVLLVILLVPGRTSRSKLTILIFGLLLLANTIIQVGCGSGGGGGDHQTGGGTPTGTYTTTITGTSDSLSHSTTVTLIVQ